MTQLHLDLTKSATRAALLSQLEAAMDPQQHQQFEDAIARINIPDTHHHHFSDVLIAIEGMDASDQVKLDMKGVYRILAEAEAAAHQVPVEETHFHEVSNGSSIKNAAVICTAFWVLEPQKVICTPVQTGSGQINCAHGVMDIPAPATRAILSRGIPVCQQKLDGELCTPTSAAIICHFANEFTE